MAVKKTKKPKKESVVKKRRAYWHKLSVLRAVIRIETLKLMGSNFLMVHSHTHSGFAYSVGAIIPELSKRILNISKFNCDECPTRLQCHLTHTGTPERISLNLPLYMIHSEKIYNHYDNCMSQQKFSGYQSNNSYWSKQWDLSGYYKTVDDLEEEYKTYFDMSEQDMKDKVLSMNHDWKLSLNQIL